MKNRYLNKRNFLFAAVLSLLYIIYSAVLAPLYSYVCTDIIYSEGYLPVLLEILLDVCQIFIWCHLFSHIITNFYFEENKGSFFIFIFSMVATALRYFLQPIISYVLSGGNTGYLFADAFFYFLFDFLQIAALTVLSAMLIKRASVTDEALKLFGKMKRDAALARTVAVISAILISLVRIGMRIRYDLFYGAPETFEDLCWMVVYYSSDILYGAVAYPIIIAFINLQRKRK